MTFVNEMAADAVNKKLEFKVAEHMQRRGARADQIYENTDIFPGPDGMLRYEISDADFEFTDEFKENGGPMPLADAIKHDEYFAAIPDAENTMIGVEPHLQEMGALGAYYDQFDLILLADYDKDVALHEMQHVAQDHLNFPPESRGTNPEAAGSLEAYWNNNGEIEARETMDSHGDDFWDGTPDLLNKAMDENDGKPEPYKPSMGMGMNV